MYKFSMFILIKLLLSPFVANFGFWLQVGVLWPKGWLGLWQRPPWIPLRAFWLTTSPTTTPLLLLTTMTASPVISAQVGSFISFLSQLSVNSFFFFFFIVMAFLSVIFVSIWCLWKHFSFFVAKTYVKRGETAINKAISSPLGMTKLTSPKRRRTV